MKFGSNPALLVIDAQEGIKEASHWGGNRNNPNAEDKIASMLDQWRRLQLPVIIVQHNSISSVSPLRSHYQGSRLMDFVKRQSSDILIQKTSASAFIYTDLLQYIEQKKVTSITITGFVTNNSVEATARSAGDLGIVASVVSDATACFDKVSIYGKKYSADVVHELSLSNIMNEYASICSTDAVIEGLAKSISFKL